MIFYELPPIDFWLGAQEFSPAAEAAIAETQSEVEDRRELAKALTAMHQAAVPVFASRFSWQGDGIWRYGAVPGDVETDLWIAVKQSDNGTTFVASRRGIGGLQKLAFDTFMPEGG